MWWEISTSPASICEDRIHSVSCYLSTSCITLKYLANPALDYQCLYGSTGGEHISLWLGWPESRKQLKLLYILSVQTVSVQKDGEIVNNIFLKVFPLINAVSLLSAWACVLSYNLVLHVVWLFRHWFCSVSQLHINALHSAVRLSWFMLS